MTSLPRFFEKFATFALLLIFSCSINETKGPDATGRNGLGPGGASNAAPSPKPKSPGPITSAATQECAGLRSEAPKSEGQSGAVLKIVPRSGLEFAKVLLSDPKSVIYLRSELTVLETGLYTVEVITDDGLACWYALDLSEEGNSVTLELGL